MPESPLLLRLVRITICAAAPALVATSLSAEPPESQPVAPAKEPGASPTAVTATYEIKSVDPGQDDFAGSVIDGDRMEITIRQPAGIGSTVVSRPKGGWPKQIVLKIHLTGLESLSLSTEKRTLHISMPSHGEGKQLSSHTRLDDEGATGGSLKSGDSLWPQVRRLHADGTPSDPKKFPLDTQLFEVTVPPGFLAENPAELQLKWIDFYRR
ncbi:MAG TPA: hypothetical protein VGE52_05380 [Pirellulales bacterium]